MVATIDTSLVSLYSDNLHMLLEQKMAKTRPLFDIEMGSGELKNFERLGNFEATEITDRFGQTVRQDPAHSRRVAYTTRLHAGTYLDDIDAFKMLIDPTSQYSLKLAMAQGKKFDDIVIEALLGDAASGKAGATAVALPSEQKIVHGSAGFTVDKFHQALQILEADEVDITLDDVYLIIPPSGKTDLFADPEVTSSDFQNSKPLADGRFPNFRGVNVVTSNRIPLISATVAQAIMCTGDALKIFMNHDIMMKTAEDHTRNYALVLDTYLMMGAVRLEEERVVSIQYEIVSGE